MNKIKFYDKRLLNKSKNFFLLEGTILGIIALFKTDLIENNALIFGIACIVILFIYHCIITIQSNMMKRVTLKIHNSTFEIKTDDIFNQNELKVINFNEYFDTKVDNKIIAKNSLNGQFIENYVDNVEELDKIISESLINEKSDEVLDRINGKKLKYQLGTIVEYKGYLLTAFSKFSKDNRATLELKDYLMFLMNFWDNLDKIYANRSVAITLFGSSSLTRFKDTNDISDQDLVEIIIWTFKVSKIKFRYPTTISLILTEDLLNRINLFEVKEMYKNGI